MAYKCYKYYNRGFLERYHGAVHHDSEKMRLTTLRKENSLLDVDRDRYPRTKVTIDSLKEVVYEKSIGTKLNDLTWPLFRSRLRSREPLHRIRH